MRRIAAIVSLLVLCIPAAAEAATTLCGRPGYPNDSEFNAAAVVDGDLWSSLRARDAFGNGTDGTGSVEVRIPGPAVVVTLEEVVVRAFVGGAEANVTAISLRVVAGSGPIAGEHNFTLLDFGGKAGGNLTLLAWFDGEAVEVFWRWAYLLCSQEFPNLYYVFHGRLGPGGIEDDNTVVYFEATRPRRGPPLDLIVLVVAGAAASAVFLYARRALRPTPQSGSESDDRTVK